MDLIADCEADYIRLAVDLGMALEEARRDWDELVALKEEDGNGN